MSISLRQVCRATGNRLSEARVRPPPPPYPHAQSHAQLWAVLSESARLIDAHAARGHLSSLVFTPDSIGLLISLSFPPHPLTRVTHTVLERRGTVRTAPGACFITV